MTRRSTSLVGALSVIAALAVPLAASAHSASDAYLTLEGRPSGVVRGQWDIALRDLDFVLDLDANGDGNITWRELRAKLAAVERYAFSGIAFRGDDQRCIVEPTDRLVSDHADGAYVALFFDVRCRPGTKRVALDYRLFFPIDPSHRAIVVWRNGDDVATAVLSPQRSTVAVAVGSR